MLQTWTQLSQSSPTPRPPPLPHSWHTCSLWAPSCTLMVSLSRESVTLIELGVCLCVPREALEVATIGGAVSNFAVESCTVPSGVLHFAESLPLSGSRRQSSSSRASRFHGNSPLVDCVGVVRHTGPCFSVRYRCMCSCAATSVFPQPHCVTDVVSQHKAASSKNVKKWYAASICAAVELILM